MAYDVDKPILSWTEWHLIENLLCEAVENKNVSGFTDKGYKKLDSVRKRISDILVQRLYGIPRKRGKKCA